MSGDAATAAMVVLVGLALMVGIQVKNSPDRVRALVKAQQAYDLERCGRAGAVPDYERRFRRQGTLTVVACGAGMAVGLAAVFLTDL